MPVPGVKTVMPVVTLLSAQFHLPTNGTVTTPLPRSKRSISSGRSTIDGGSGWPDVRSALMPPPPRVRDQEFAGGVDLVDDGPVGERPPLGEVRGDLVRREGVGVRVELVEHEPVLVVGDRAHVEAQAAGLVAHRRLRVGRDAGQELFPQLGSHLELHHQAEHALPPKVGICIRVCIQ